MRYQVEIMVPAYIVVEVEAPYEEQAKDAALDIIHKTDIYTINWDNPEIVRCQEIPADWN